MCVRDYLYLCKQNSITIFSMSGITAKRNSVSVPKTAVSCGQTPSAAIRCVRTSGGNPKAAIPEMVIIGDRGLTFLAANIAQESASSTITLFINTFKLRHDDPRHPHPCIPIA